MLAYSQPAPAFTAIVAGKDLPRGTGEHDLAPRLLVAGDTVGLEALQLPFLHLEGGGRGGLVEPLLELAGELGHSVLADDRANVHVERDGNGGRKLLGGDDPRLRRLARGRR